MHLARAIDPDTCAAGGTGAIMTVDFAAAKAVAAVTPVAETETVDLLDANGRVLALCASFAPTMRKSTFSIRQCSANY